MRTKIGMLFCFALASGFLLLAPSRAICAMDESQYQRIQDFKMWKLTSVLKLTQDQSPQFFSVFSQLENLNQDFMATKHKLMQKLDEFTRQPNENAQSLGATLSELKQQEENYLDRKKDLEANLFGILTPTQQALYIKFQTEFPRMLRQMARRRGGQGMDQDSRQGGQRRENRQFQQRPQPQGDRPLQQSPQNDMPPDEGSASDEQDGGDEMNYDNNRPW